MRPTLAVVLLCLIGLAAPSALTPKHRRQPRGGAIPAAPAGRMDLRMEARSPANKNNPSNVGETGNGEMVFEVRGKAIVATDSQPDAEDDMHERRHFGRRCCDVQPVLRPWHKAALRPSRP